MLHNNDPMDNADVFAVVSEVEGEGYRLSVYTDDTVPPFGPSLPCPPIFNDPQLFREFLLVSILYKFNNFHIHINTL